MNIHCRMSRFRGLLVLVGTAALIAGAQPSGGPYGPTGRSYSLPAGGGTTYFAAPDGEAKSVGFRPEKPTTLEAAIERVRTGDVIVLRGGTYRTGSLVLNQGVTLQPYADERPILKGTFVASEWEKLGDGLWVTGWKRLFPAKPDSWWRRNREGKNTPLVRFNNDMVFVDGRFLQAVGWEGEVDEDSFFIDYGTGQVFIGCDPAGRLVEITAFDVALRRTTGEVHGKKSDRKGFTLRGLTLTQYAYRALEVEGSEPAGISAESDHGKDVVGTTLEDCTISFCSRVAGYFRGDRLTVRHCRVSDTSTEGLYIIASNDVLLEGNIFRRNNIERITGYYPAAVKIFNQCHRVTCRDNLVTDLPHSNGIWYDVGNVDGVFVNNWIEKVGRRTTPFRGDRLWPSDNGFFFEISTGAVCAGNVFVDCDHGIMILNSANVRIYQNTFVNSAACIGRDGRVAEGDLFGWHASTGPGLEKREGHVFVNNLLTGDASMGRPLLFVWQPAALCGRLSRPMMDEMDHNVYVSAEGNPAIPAILWSPAATESCQSAFTAAESLHAAAPAFCASGVTYPGYDGPLFKGRELGNYQLLPGFAGLRAAGRRPREVKELLGETAGNIPYIGAYPQESGK